MTFPTTHGLSAAPVGIGHGLRLRTAHAGDMTFLRRLYRTFRAEEVAPLPWPEAAKDAFLDDQFRLQHEHFTTVFADADFLVVEQGGAAVGRLYLQRSDQGVLIVDIGLLPQVRRQGLGRAVMEWVVQEAVRARASRVWLHVLSSNLAARRLYERLGFAAVSEDGGRIRMERVPG